MNFWIASKALLDFRVRTDCEPIATNAVGVAKEHDAGVAQRRDHAVLNRNNGGFEHARPIKSPEPFDFLSRGHCALPAVLKGFVSLPVA